MADETAAPKIKSAEEIGGGMSRRQLKKLHMQSMTREERGYLRRKAAAEKVWPVFRAVILIGLGFVIMYPLIYMISCAFRERADMSDPTDGFIEDMLFSPGVVFEVQQSKYDRNYLLAITGYGFARFEFRGKKLFFAIVIMMILVPTQVISLPLYTLFRYFGIKGLFSVNLIDSRLTMYLPAMTANGIRAGLMIFIFRQFFKGLPRELEDAAYIDGCGPFRTFVSVIVPNAAPAFLTVFLFSVVWYWNDYYVSNTFFTNTKTIALMLTNLDNELKIRLFNDPTVQISPREQIVWKEAGCLLSIAPVLLMYVFMQKHFTEGIERSGIVG